MIIENQNAETLNELMSEKDFYQIGEDYYFKIGKYYYYLHQYAPNYDGELNYILKDITNAGKIGKDCTEYRLTGKLVDFDQILKCNFDDIFFKIATDSIKGIKVNKYTIKGIDVFNPLTIKETYKPLKEEPEKWTLKHALRAIVNCQFVNFKCDGYYTDDYAWDNANNFGIKEIKNTFYFLKKVIENKSGWRVYKYDNKIHINCYSFDCNSFEFVG